MRNGTAVAMMQRFGGKGGIMHDRRAPRGGAINEARDLLDEYQDLCTEAKAYTQELYEPGANLDVKG